MPGNVELTPLMVIFNRIPGLKTGQVKARISWRALTSPLLPTTSMLPLCDHLPVILSGCKDRPNQIYSMQGSKKCYTDIADLGHRNVRLGNDQKRKELTAIETK